jgi:hypothetical protein
VAGFFYAFCTDSPEVTPVHSVRHQAMLIEIYTEALLADDDLDDQVWELWDRGMIDDELALIAWLQIVTWV